MSGAVKAKGLPADVLPVHQFISSTRDASRTTGSERVRTTVLMEPLYPASEVRTASDGGLMGLAFPIAALGTLVAVGLGSLAVAALALAHVVAPWASSSPTPCPRSSSSAGRWPSSHPLWRDAARRRCTAGVRPGRTRRSR